MGRIASFYKRSAVSSVFGAKRGAGRKHRGVDFSHSVKPGTVPVPAFRSGKVIEVRKPSLWHGFGHGIVIRSADGVWNISYNHGSSKPHFKVGDFVNAGDTVLFEGTTGATTGSCVHIEAQRVGGGFIDPLPMILDYAVKDAHPSGGNTKPSNTKPSNTKPSNTNSKDDDMIIRIKGRAGARNGGLYLFANGRRVFLGSDAGEGFPLIDDEGQINKLFAQYPA